MSVEAQAEVEHCGNIFTEMLLPRPEYAHMTQMEADIVYDNAGVISKNVKKKLLVLPVVISLEKTLL